MDVVKGTSGVSAKSTFIEEANPGIVKLLGFSVSNEDDISQGLLILNDADFNY
jgi:hypothetical protein